MAYVKGNDDPGKEGRLAVCPAGLLCMLPAGRPGSTFRQTASLGKQKPNGGQAR